MFSVNARHRMQETVIKYYVNCEAIDVTKVTLFGFVCRRKPPRKRDAHELHKQTALDAVGKTMRKRHKGTQCF